MRKSPQFKLKHMKTAIRIISGLPEKDDRCSREEAAEQLAEHFKRAFRKGYTPREVSASLRKEGIIMAEQLIARYQEPDDDAENKRDQAGGGKKDSQKRAEQDRRTRKRCLAIRPHPFRKTSHPGRRT